ncbi:hypothetical protein [Pleionea litopenaei]|uniref:Uncharacterized protein n=1 Tax=Pleionea litopenaei TaxID=3070815 RepID=A0AA51RSB0_9GAMM|nr:hypothetical protein [Pleionea sp. HL-JVS1]WMS86594.1 hypothetical protein Q9312_15340 [Pleionea sp. HL-JVS1]
MVRNPSNPTVEEIKEWAYSDEVEPHQEWELFLLWKGEFIDYLKFASDINCPKESFFLDLLYYWIWRIAVERANENEVESFKEVFEKAESINTPYVRLWLQRSQELLAGTREVDESSWRENRRPYENLS